MQETTRKSYGDAVDVAALTPRFTNAGDFDALTRPTAGQVNSWIDRVSAILNVILAEHNFALPVVQPDVVLFLEQFVITQVADLANYANSAGRFFSDKNFTTGPWQAIQKEAADFIDKHAEGLQNLGATRSVAGLDALDFRSTDDSGAEIEPMFARKQFGNKTTDWDVP